ncbi:MAG: hypothetical protein ACREFY_05680, partial [Acetobacteraceae bacterium]
AKAEADYRAAAAAAKPMTDAADAALAAPNVPPSVAAGAGTYQAATAAVTAAVQTRSYGLALQQLDRRENAARAIMMERGKLDAAAQKRKQLDAQVATYDSMAPVLDDVKRTYLTAGTAQRIEGEKLDPGKHFQAFLVELKTLEAAKQGVKSGVATNPTLAANVKQQCDAVVAAAQAYLAHYDADLSKTQQRSKDSLAKKRHCEVTIVTARQYGMAMELDAAGKPTTTAPWNAQTETRVAGVRAAFSYEQGAFAASGLKEGGDAAGKSDAYWIKGATISPDSGLLKKNKQGDFIFKPMDGEAAMDGSTDQPGAGAAKEALAYGNARRFAAQTGIDLGVPETNVVAIGQHALTGGDPTQPPLIGSVQAHAGATTQIADLPKDVYKNIKREDVHNIALLDIMSLSVDRHGGNIMVDAADPNNPKLVPIDHGGTLPNRSDFATLKTRFGGVTDSMMGGVSVVNELLNIPAAYEDFDPGTQAKIALLDPAAMEQGMRDQRTDLDAVHPGLDAGAKVSDESFRMSKRSMMFLKLAAGTLSPAEIQIAIAAYPVEVFDSTDNDFERVAKQVIAEAAPKKDAYLEFLTAPQEEQKEILDWLGNNGWTCADEQGNGSSVELLMKDPVNALKLYKSQTPNTNPPTGGFSPLKPAQLTGDKMPDQKMIDTISKAFPNARAPTADNYDKVWSNRLAYWQALGAKGGMAAYQNVLTATGADPQDRIADSLDTMNYWDEINKPENQAALAALPQYLGPKDPMDVIRTALEKTKGAELARQQLDQTRSVGGAVDSDAAAASSATRLVKEARATIARLADQGEAARLTRAVVAAEAKQQQGDVAGGEADARAAYKDSMDAAFQEAKQRAIGMRDQIDALDLTPAQAIQYATIRDSADGCRSVSTADAAYDQLRKFHDQWVRAGAAPAAGAGPLPAFTWNQPDASAAKKQAVAAGLFKDQDTGMTAALKAVNEARAAADVMKADLTSRMKLERLRAAIGACRAFAGFATGKLRSLSADKRWTAYCDDAAARAEQEIPRYTKLIADFDPGAGLPPFSFLDADASALKKLAVKNKIIKDQDTGMSAALKAVNAARNEASNMSPTLSVAGQKQALQKASVALTKFLDFVNRKLRVLSRDPRWAEYCADAVTTVQKEIDVVALRLGNLG